MDDTLQRKTQQRFASLCVSIKAIPTASSETRMRGFFMPPIRVLTVKQIATQNEDRPGSCEVKRNVGMKGKQ